MGTLSNFLRRADGRADGPAAAAAPLACRAATHKQVHPALRLVLGSGGRLADEGAVVDFLQLAVQRRIDLNDLWVAERAGRVVWAMLPIVGPGRTMLLIAPGGRARGQARGDDAAGALVDAVCAQFAARGVLMAQVLLDPTDAIARDAYVGRGFHQMAELLYLQAEVRRTLPAPPLPDGFDWLTYAPENHATFADAIIQSYRDSLDCPGLNGLRDIEDVIAGHKASGGKFDPSWWFVLRERGRAVAVLLLSRTAAQATAELVYLGLVPDARGRGLADLVMRNALHVVASAGCAAVALAVDAQNAPALRLYHRHGLRRIGSKLALMRQLLRDPVARVEAVAPA